MNERLIVAYTLLGMLIILAGIMAWSVWHNLPAQKEARYRKEARRKRKNHDALLKDRETRS